MSSSFRTRLIVIFGGLFSVALVATFLGVNEAQKSAATKAVSEDLELDSTVFALLVSQRSKQLHEAARLTVSDFAFKKAYVIGEAATWVSAMDNFMNRVDDADIMLLLSLDGEVLASTEQFEDLDSIGASLQELMYNAEDDEFLEASGALSLGDRLFQLMVVPLLAPDLEAWVVVGFAIDQGFVKEFADVTRADVTVVRRQGDQWFQEATTEPDSYGDLAEQLQGDPQSLDRVLTVELGGREFITRPLQLSEGKEAVLAILQRPLDQELASYQDVRRVLMGIFALGLIGAVLGAVLASRSVTRPVLAIAAAARRIEKGEFDQSLDERRSDEIGRMARSFNHMAQGLAEKERVRNLLGKVVSPAIAEELLKQDVDLGGEEREVTILFSDVRSFTSLCEGRSPGEILDFLNLYLSEVSEVISKRRGVVDKYIGDAVMALFGAPVTRADDPTNAVLSAHEMLSAVDRINPLVREKGWPLLRIGVGINTDLVVAGNMGSVERLNYTVIGDGVNLAARLEGLTKRYGVPILVTEFTAQRVNGLRFRELDRVRVKGKKQPVGLYESLGDTAREDPEDDLFARGLRLYRQRSWVSAAACFEGFAAQSPRHQKVVTMFLSRIEHLRNHPPSQGWDTTHTFTDK